jgi:hypothetical protein
MREIISARDCLDSQCSLWAAIATPYLGITKRDDAVVDKDGRRVIDSRDNALALFAASFSTTRRKSTTQQEFLIP